MTTINLKSDLAEQVTYFSEQDQVSLETFVDRIFGYQNYIGIFIH